MDSVDHVNDKYVGRDANYKGENLPVKVNSAGREYVVFEKGDLFGVIFLDKFQESVKPMEKARQQEHRPVKNPTKHPGSGIQQKVKGLLNTLSSPIQYLFPHQKTEKKETMDKDLKKLLHDVAGKSDQEAFDAIRNSEFQIRGKSLKDKKLGAQFNELVQRLGQSPALTPSDRERISFHTINIYS